MENDLKGNKNCLELAGGSSYTEGSSYWESTVELAGGSSYRGFKLLGVHCDTFGN